MQRLIQTFILTALLSLMACQSLQSTPAQLPASIQIGSQYYSQVTLQHEKGKFRTTNYRRGILLGINTQVELLEATSRSIKVKLIKSGEELTIANSPKYTGDDIYQAFDKIFARQPLSLHKFSHLERQNIAAAKAGIGMSKDAVLAAIGYPPITKTPSLEASQWRYWSNRFNTFVVHFSNGTVSRIQN